MQQIAQGAIKLPYTRKVVERHRNLTTRLGAIAGLSGLPLVGALWDPTDPDTLTIRLAAGAIATTVADPEQIHARLAEVITQPELPDSAGDIIRIMSLHKSKGLTAELVIVTGCVAGALPTVDEDLPPAEQDADLKEQRRLFYVAITRARDTLVLSSVTSLPLRIALRANIPPTRVYKHQTETFARLSSSPFIGELGPSAPNTIAGADWRTTLHF